MKQTIKFLTSIFITILFCLNLINAANNSELKNSDNLTAAAAAVTLSEDDASFTLANAAVTARISKQSGDLISLKYKGLELLEGGSGHPFGYCSHSPSKKT